MHRAVWACSVWRCGGDASEGKTSDSDRNLRIYKKLLARGEQLDARGQFYYARELMIHQQFAQAVAAFEDFCRDRTAGSKTG